MREQNLAKGLWLEQTKSMLSKTDIKIIITFLIMFYVAT